MGTFGEFFGFDGNLNRLGYLWRTAVIIVVIGGLANGALWATTHLIDPDGVTGGGAFDGQIITGAFLLGLWSSFALTTRRIRDIGLEPAHIVPLYAALWVVNAVLLQPMSRLDPRDFGAAEAVWVVMQWLAAVPLLIWPTNNPRAAIGPREFHRPEPTAYLNWREGA